jgi:integrase
MAFKRSGVRIPSAPIDENTGKRRGPEMTQTKKKNQKVQQSKKPIQQKKSKKFSGRIPKLLTHARSGRAFVIDPGPPRRQVAMGKAETETALTNYRRWVASFLARQGQLPDSVRGKPQTVAGLLASWLESCRVKYVRPDGTNTSEFSACRQACEFAATWADLPIHDFTRANLVQIRDECRKTMARPSIHIMVDRIVRAFRWGESRDWVDPGQVARLARWERLRPTEGRSFRPPRYVRPVDLVRVYRFLGTTWREAFLFHCYTGQRVETALKARVEDFDRGRTPWEYRPPHHKNTWRGKPLVILVGPKARKVLSKSIDRVKTGFLWQSTPCGKSVGYSGPLTHAGYRRALSNASTKAGIKPPVLGRSIRHAAASHLRTHGVSLDLISAILGHSGAIGAETASAGTGMTSHYAKIHRRAVEEVVEKFG